MEASATSPTSDKGDGGVEVNSEHTKHDSIFGQEQAPIAPPEESRYFTGKKLILVHAAMLSSILLIALDQSIVATAIPRIVSHFHALSSVTWIASAYFLTQAGFILFYGKLLAIFPTKYVYLTAITLFELGSLVCAVSKSMNVLIFGRAFSGVGAAGIFSSVVAIIAEIAPIQKRPLLFGSFGAIFALASVMGPLLGGVFTDHVSWRWCFYINLPIGALSVFVIVLFLKAEYTALNRSDNLEFNVWQRWLRLDWAGTFLCLGMVTSLLLPLQWGGSTKAWNDRVVIALFCVFGVVLIAFILLEWKMGKRAMLPLHMFRRRTQIGCCLTSFFVMMMLLVGIYYLPLFYQAKGRSATKSGIDILPFMLSVVVGAGTSGGVIAATGLYWYWLVLSPPVASIGAGLLFTMDRSTPQSRLIGYQILYGIGIGGALQNSFIAIQAEYNSEEHMIPQSSSMVQFTQLVGGIVGIAIAGSIFTNQLVKELAKFAPNLPPNVVHGVRQSVTFIFTLPLNERDPVISAYSRSLGYAWLLSVPCGAFASLSSFFLIRSYNIKKLNMPAGGGSGV